MAETSLLSNVIARRQAAVPRGVGAVHPIVLERGEGARVWDDAGRAYYDFVGGIGVINAGHCHPKIAQAIARQSQQLIHTCFQVATYEGYVAVAEELNKRAPGTMPKKTLLLSTGAEATENAVKIARAHTRRSAVIGFAHGYHGRTLLALTMTGKNAPYKQHFGPYCPEVYHTPFPHERHGVTTRDAIAGIENIFDSVVSPDRVAAFIIEPILGEGGFVPAPADFIHELRRIATQHGIVFIADEVQSGFGRTGTFFASEHYGLVPDIVTTAKSIAGGIPLAAVTGKADIMDAPTPGGLGGTFAGNPVACAAALATFEIMDEAFMTRARSIGTRIKETLLQLQARHDAIAEVRGIGAMMAMELSRGAERVVEIARERGLLLMLAGKRDTVRILVPLVISDAELAEALGILSTATAEALA